MLCENCGAPLMVIRIEEYPEGLKGKIEYNRLCDVKCLNDECGKVYYSQPYDFGKLINPVKKIGIRQE
jgi:hypothetical protein